MNRQLGQQEINFSFKINAKIRSNDMVMVERFSLSCIWGKGKYRGWFS